MSIMVFAEQRQGKLRKPVAEALSQGRRMADTTHDRLFVSLIGSGIAGLTKELIKYGGDEIFVTDDKDLSLYDTERYASILTAAIKEIQPNFVFFTHSAMGKDLAPRVAERIGAGLASDCIGMETRGEEVYFVRPLYSGKILAKVRITTPIKMASLRPNNFLIEERNGQGQIREFKVHLPVSRAQARKVNLQDTARPELTEAEIIVSGGRGLGNADGFQVVAQLADMVGAAVGASRAAVDAGWQTNQHQVGLTGKIVTPKLYVACGISGAIQHLAGMGSSRCIVAINKDANANIMRVADFAIEGDLYSVIPELIKKMAEAKNKK
jgi:electron transfer flavoprotein alpha subunit